MTPRGVCGWCGAMKAILFGLGTLAIAAAIAACGSDDCKACAEAAAAAHSQATLTGDNFKVVCTSTSGVSSKVELEVAQCSGELLGVTIEVKPMIKDTLTDCGLSVPSECE